MESVIDTAVLWAWRLVIVAFWIIGTVLGVLVAVAVAVRLHVLTRRVKGERREPRVGDVWWDPMGPLWVVGRHEDSQTLDLARPREHRDVPGLPGKLSAVQCWFETFDEFRFRRRMRGRYFIRTSDPEDSPVRHRTTLDRPRDMESPIDTETLH